MARIRSSDTAPEVALRRALHAVGLRFRLHRKDLPGKPDIVLPRRNAVILVHGCFWHRHEGCSIATTPKSNTSFWADKFERNVARDARVRGKLEELGWRVFVAWECEVASRRRAMQTAGRIARELGHEPPSPTPNN
jgi:DNA mismatch endonuclease (patch repair protein)